MLRNGLMAAALMAFVGTPLMGSMPIAPMLSQYAGSWSMSKGETSCVIALSPNASVVDPLHCLRRMDLGWADRWRAGTDGFSIFSGTSPVRLAASFGGAVSGRGRTYVQIAPMGVAPTVATRL